jgi:hypothetical protein
MTRRTQGLGGVFREKNSHAVPLPLPYNNISIMPITYTPTRKNRGSTTIRRETKYERVPPSRLRFIPLQKAVKFGTMLFTHYYHLFAFAIFHLIRHKKILKVDSKLD